MVANFLNGVASTLGFDVTATATTTSTAGRTRRGRRFSAGLGLDTLEGRIAPSGYSLSYGNQDEPPVEVAPQTDGTAQTDDQAPLVGMNYDL